MLIQYVKSAVYNKLGDFAGTQYIGLNVMFVEDIQENFVRSLAAGGLQVDRLKTDVNFSTVGPYYLGVNLTELTVSVVILVIFTRLLSVPCTTV